MSTSAISSPARSGGSSWGPGSVVGVVAGSILGLVALALALAGLAMVVVHFGFRDDHGFINSHTRHFSTPTYALTAEEIQLGDMHGGAGDWAIEHLGGTVRLRAQLDGGAPVFVGIARTGDVQRYLAGVAHDRIEDWDMHHRLGDNLVRTAGTAAPVPPGRASFWVASASGPGSQTATWKVSTGEWAAVVMRADGRRDVSADVRLGGRMTWLPWIGLALLAIGSGALAGAAGLIAFSGRRAGRGPGPGAPAPVGTSPAATLAAAEGVAAASEAGPVHPVDVRAQLDEPLSRWYWLVKWALVIPHLIVLVVLYAAFVVSAIIGVGVAAATGRYPRALFDFEVGVLRWGWRVELYANGAFATDRYPPFSLASDPSYPADLDIPYPEERIGGRVLFQYLLAAPHWLVLGALLGGGWWFEDVRIPGLLPILVCIAVITLLFTGRYPRDVFRLIVGIHRWILRTIAYAAGLTSVYPPFRLDR